MRICAHLRSICYAVSYWRWEPALFGPDLLPEIYHLQITLSGDGVESDQSGQLDISQPTGYVGLADFIDAKRIAGGPEQSRMRRKTSVIINHAHQAAVEKLRLWSELVDSFAGQNSFPDDSIWHVSTHFSANTSR